MPYLGIDEQSTYIDVTCDGYVARVYSGGSEIFIGRIYDPDAVGTTPWFTFGSKCVVGGTTYALSENTGIAVTVIENTSIRCIINAVGDFEDSSQGSLANESGSSLILTFYPDRFTQEIQFVNSGTITLSDSAINGFCFMEAVTANIASEDAVYENAGSESLVTSDAEYNSADYIGITSTEMNIIGINFEETRAGASTFGQYVDDPEGLRFRWNNGTLTAETHTMSVMWIIDSAEREGSAKLYDSADRLEQGIQYTNPALLTFNEGSAVTSGTGHTSIGTDGFASDGAYHIQGEYS